MDYKNIKVEKEDNILFLIINRKEKRNALDVGVLNEMKDCLETIKDDENVGIVVITGDGDRSFAAGADINELKYKTALDILQTGGMKEFYNYLDNYEKPTIAMINGHALGGGCELALACDIRIASLNAKIGLPELNLAIIPGAGGTQRLTRLIGEGKATELILTGEILSAENAKEIGMLSDVVSTEELKSTVVEKAKAILNKGPLAVQLAKLSIKYGAETNINAGLIIEKLAQAVLFSTEDKREGTTSFLEKRSPNYQGK